MESFNKPSILLMINNSQHLKIVVLYLHVNVEWAKHEPIVKAKDTYHLHYKFDVHNVDVRCKSFI
jgi:hypothetical protein